MAVVETEIKDGIARVRLNRPERKNALSQEMFDEIAAAGEALKTEAALRAVILEGAGGDFCAGLDRALFGAFAQDIAAVRARLLTPLDGAAANWFQRPCTVWRDLPVPVIAAIEGVCLGGGLQIALGADFRIAHPQARLSIMEAKWGLIPDMGISQSLPALMPADQAKRLMMTAKMLSGAEALRAGLVTELADAPGAAALDLARALCGVAPAVLAGVKEMVDTGWGLPAGERLQQEARLQAPIIGSPDQIEAVQASLAGRAPKFG